MFVKLHFDEFVTIICLARVPLEQILCRKRFESTFNKVRVRASPNAHPEPIRTRDHEISLWTCDRVTVSVGSADPCADKPPGGATGYFSCSDHLRCGCSDDFVVLEFSRRPSLRCSKSALSVFRFNNNGSSREQAALKLIRNRVRLAQSNFLLQCVGHSPPGRGPSPQPRCRR